MATLHQVNVWNDKEIGPAAMALMPHSLLWLPAGRELGQPGPAIVFAPRWGGYPYDALPREIGPAIADRGVAFLSLAVRRRGAEGQLVTLPDDDTRDIKLGIDYLQALGFTDTVLAGEEVGALSVVRYQAKSRDLRTRGVALIRPIADLAAWLADAMGADAYAKQARWSGVAARQGAGMDDLVDLTITGPAGQPMLIQQFSAIWLMWWSRIADTSIRKLLPDVLAPVAITGGDDLAGLTIRPATPLDEANLAAGLADFAIGRSQGGVISAPLSMVTATAPDGKVLAGLLWEPAEGPGETAILLVHGLTGGPQSPLYAKLAPMYASRGIAALTIETHRSGRAGQLTATIDDDVNDIDAFVQLLLDRGYRQIVLSGASLGSISIMLYQSRRQHPNVAALVHQAPTADCADWARRGMGDALYNETVERCRRAVAEGRGDQELVDVTYRRADPDRYHILMRYPQRAASWLSWWGPDADSANSVHIQRVRVPNLLLAGTEDNYNNPDRMNYLESLAIAPCQQIWYDDCDHGFAGFEGQVVRDVVAWLETGDTWQRSA